MIKLSTGRMNDATKDIFNSYCIPEPMSGCWLWMYNTNLKGYGQMRFRGTTMLSHRVSYLLNKGDIPVGMLVLHTCDTPSCINPDHLWLGTYQDNVDDMKIKGRERILYGENNGRFKFSNTLVEDIRRLRISGVEIATLAKMYHIGKTTIGNILYAKGRFSNLTPVHLGFKWSRYHARKKTSAIY